MAICWERAVPLAGVSRAVFLILGVPVPFCVQGRMWNSIVSVPDHCLFIYFDYIFQWFIIIVSPN